MVKVITKEELISSAGIKTGSQTNIVQILDKVNQLLNTPIVKDIVGRLIAKYLGVSGQTAKSVEIPPVVMAKNGKQKQIKLNGEMLYNMLTGIIDKLILVAGNMTISELKNYLVQNKEQSIKIFNEAIQNIK